ncbi:membrane protein insertion efficiency factor YidD [Limisalsivibrio acetivorans]|uniref:membrane protein insertion efficiency factor YidD n=1 Tax=Limisalsivibrio acetivorans TaxID=1304888 RepID=UPI0009DC01FE|nr:membrane protein insertion efficiency factor YidD [Limisalsivibrio acetivorans]
MKLSGFWRKYGAGAPLVALIRLYQKAVSPILGNRCRFYPSCSEYAVEAIRKKGIMLGTVLAVWRILRCNPLSKGGHDPVK